ncbi:MAG: DNA polymerase III subunit delta, partial [Gemmataceae bacterium]
GVPPFGKASAEAQLRKIGKAKAGQILNWLVEADIGMKGGSFIEPSAILERLLAKLSGKGSA